MSSPRRRSRVFRIWMVVAVVLLVDFVVVVLPVSQHRLPHSSSIRTCLISRSYGTPTPVMGLTRHTGTDQFVYLARTTLGYDGVELFRPVLPFPAQRGIVTPFYAEATYFFFNLMTAEQLRSSHEQLVQAMKSDPQFADLPQWCWDATDGWSPTSAGPHSTHRISWPLAIHDALFILTMAFIAFVPARAGFRHLKSLALPPPGICPFCRYDMTGTPGPVCPECGKRPR